MRLRIVFFMPSYVCIISPLGVLVGPVASQSNRRSQSDPARARTGSRFYPVSYLDTLRVRSEDHGGIGAAELILRANMAVDLLPAMLSVNEDHMTVEVARLTMRDSGELLIELFDNRGALTRSNPMRIQGDVCATRIHWADFQSGESSAQTRRNYSRRIE